MRLLSSYINSDSNEVGFRESRIKNEKYYADRINLFKPQVLIAENTLENLAIINLSKNGWYGFGLYQPSERLIQKIEELKYLPKIIYLHKSNKLIKEWSLFGQVVFSQCEYEEESNKLVFSSLL